MSKLYVFTGPTLSPDDGRAILDAVYLPPVSQGDVYSLCREAPWGIGIIDGYFERVPAVWHKEILWAMDHGIHVFGAASLGALRAAELAAFGMEGIGAVFEAFRDGVLEDDDEVVVLHGPAETGYQAVSEALVNIRATLAAAETAGIIAPATRETLIRFAKQCHYADRNYPGLLQQAAAQGLATAELAALATWLPEHSVNQKRLDALALLAYMQERRITHPEPKQVSFTFQHTDAWEQVRRQIDRRPLDDRPGADTYQPDAVLDELRVRGKNAYQQERREALLRKLALALAEQENMQVETALLEKTIVAFCREHNLITSAALTGWLQQQQLSPAEYEWLMKDEAKVRRIMQIMAADLDRHLPPQLRLSGQYGSLAQRARHKQQMLALYGLENPKLSDTGLDGAGLWRWYFEEQLGCPVPANLRHYAKELDCDSQGILQRLLLREFCFLRLLRDSDEIEEGRSLGSQRRTK